MTATFPRRNKATGDIDQVVYYSAAEVADMLHVSVSTVRKYAAAERWPSFELVGVRHFSAEHIDRIMELHTHDPDALPDYGKTTPRLGVVVDSTDLESLE